MTEISTHRIIQIGQLKDRLSSMAKMAHGRAKNLMRIGNHKGAKHFFYKADRCGRLAAKCHFIIQNNIRKGNR